MLRITLLLTLFPTITLAQAPSTKPDYDRASRIDALTQGKVYSPYINAHWEEPALFWYRRDLPTGKREFVKVEAETGKAELAFDHALIAKLLSTAQNKPITADQLPIDGIHFSHEGKPGLWLEVGLKTYAFDKEKPELTESKLRWPMTFVSPLARPVRETNFATPRSTPPRNSNISPDGRWLVYIKGSTLLLGDLQDTREYTLAQCETPEIFEPRWYWSPDSTRLVVLKTSPAEKHNVTFVESTPRNRIEPIVHTLNYLKPGDKVAISKPMMFDVATQKRIAINDELFANPYSNTRWQWQENSNEFTFLFNQRGHETVRWIGINKEGQVRPIINEESRTFVDYSQKTFLYPLPERQEAVWLSERDGYAHLYLFDTSTGRVKTQITQGDWVVRGVDRVDEEKRQIWFRLAGYYPKQDPYFLHYARINMDGTGLTLLTEGDGTHAIHYSQDRRFYLDVWSRVDQPNIIELRRTENGKRICTLETGDVTALTKTGWNLPEPFVAKGRDGQTDIYGVIYRPTHFDPNRKYPVIEDIYAGPHGAHVPKAFRPSFGQQQLAELGFIVVQMDGMGTNHRSKAFHDVAWKNIGDGGFPDRIAWIKAAAAKYPYMDTSRVGIFGTSAGGQNSLRGMLVHGDFYKVCVSSCGCHDNRMDKIWWNEAWMGWPIGKHYEEQSNVTQAHRLQGKLLLMVGEVDRNVDPASTMQVAAALIKANKDFDFLVLPGLDHTGGGPYGNRKRWDFFVRHLLNVEPR